MRHHPDFRIESGRELHRGVRFDAGDLKGRFDRFAEIHHHLILVRATRVGEELIDDVFHLFEVAHHGVPGIFGKVREFHFQAQTRDRRAQVVGDPRKEKFAVGFDTLQVSHHLVEGAVDSLNFRGRRVFGERIGVLAPAELRRKERQTRQRLNHVPREGGRAEKRREARCQRPPEPGSAVGRI